MRGLRIPLRIVFYRVSPKWVAHCLEFDLMGDGRTKREALDQLMEAMALQIEASLKYENPCNLFKPADGRFFAMFAAGKDVALGECHLRFDSVVIDEAQTREYEAEPNREPDLACT